MRLSVIIPAYNRHELTVRHVAECLKSTRLPDEIIVVNDGGDPSLRGLLLPLRGKVPLVYSRVDEDILWNYNGAVNLGAWISKGDLVSVEDTDHIPDRDVYEKAVRIFENDPALDRLAFRRKCVDITELSKPLEEWVHHKTWGANQMVTIMRRELYVRLKGQDERFAGGYGWMTYDWVNRYRNILKAKSTTSEWFYAILDGGEPNLSRKMSPENHRIYRENAVSEKLQHPKGILNFTFTLETL